MSRTKAEHPATAVLRALLEELAHTPEPGRDSLMASRLHLLEGNDSDLAARLLCDLVTSKIAGVRPSTVAAVAATVDPSKIVTCLRRLPSPRPYQASHICATLRWEDALHVVSAVRDAAPSQAVFHGFRDQVLGLGFHLAADDHLPYDQDVMSLNRSDGGEVVFLFGAARSPTELLRRISLLRVHTRPRLNQDADLTRWALANPALTGTARAHVLAHTSSRVVAALRGEGILGLSETVTWLRSGDPDEVTERIVSVLNLLPAEPGAAALHHVAAKTCVDLSRVASLLSPSTRRRLSETLVGPACHSEYAGVVETVDALLSEWRSTPASLVEAAFSLRDTNSRHTGPGPQA